MNEYCIVKNGINVGEVIVRAAIELHIAKVLLCEAVHMYTLTHIHVCCVALWTRIRIEANIECGVE